MSAPVLSLALLACTAGAVLDGPGAACHSDAQEACHARLDGDLLLLQKGMRQRVAGAEPTNFDLDFIHDSHNTLEAYTEANAKEEAAEQARKAAAGSVLGAQQAQQQGKAAPVPPASLSHVGGVSKTVQAPEAAPNASDAAPPAAPPAAPSANASIAANATSDPPEVPAVANQTAPAAGDPNVTNVSNQSVPPEVSPAAVTGCATRYDERIEAWLRVTAAPGTPCLFGVDARDEGKHCIMDGGEFGTFGWCWTTADKGEWGSCNEQCPLFGQAKALAKKVDAVSDVVGRIVEHVAATSGTAGSEEAPSSSAATPSENSTVTFL